MSYDVSAKFHSQRSREDWREHERHQLELEDRVRLEFLKALDAAKVRLTDWEEQFVAGFVAEPKPLSARQREVVDELQTRYGHQIASPPARLAALDLPSVAGKCDYLVRGDDRVQRRCGQTATVTLRAGLQLCGEHERERQAGIERIRQLKARTLRS